MVWYSHLLKNFPQFVMIHTVKGFGIVNKAEVDIFLDLSCFLNDRTDVGNLPEEKEPDSYGSPDLPLGYSNTDTDMSSVGPRT